MNPTPIKVEPGTNLPQSIPFTETQLQPPEYLWIEYWTNINGTTPEKRCENFTYIDGPGYRFEAGTLKSSFHIDFKNSKSILGCGEQLNNPVGSGILSNLYPIKVFPYTPEWVDFCQTLTINNIDASGTLSARVNNKNISLEIGREWTDSVIDNSDAHCQKTTTHRLTNHGFITPERIIVPVK